MFLITRARLYPEEVRQEVTHTGLINWDSLNFCVKKWRNLLNYDCTKVKTLEGTLFQFTNKT